MKQKARSLLVPLHYPIILIITPLVKVWGVCNVLLRDAMFNEKIDRLAHAQIVMQVFEYALVR